jgi:hypothetical protein
MVMQGVLLSESKEEDDSDNEEDKDAGGAGEGVQSRGRLRWWATSSSVLLN